jgi:hypothetical protein
MGRAFHRRLYLQWGCGLVHQGTPLTEGIDFFEKTKAKRNLEVPLCPDAGILHQIVKNRVQAADGLRSRTKSMASPVRTRNGMAP